MNSGRSNFFIRSLFGLGALALIVTAFISGIAILWLIAALPSFVLILILKQQRENILALIWIFATLVCILNFLIRL